MVFGQKGGFRRGQSSCGGIRPFGRAAFQCAARRSKRLQAALRRFSGRRRSSLAASFIVDWLRALRANGWGMYSVIQNLLQSLNAVILGKEETIRLAVCCVLSRGHILFQDLPGVGKTTLAQALAAGLGMRCKRVQFTNDMLPADLVGVNVFSQAENRFVFRPGPVFNNFLLADEINRASPKAQSALLEAMEEKQVSVDGQTYKLREPFLVVATQNPLEQVGVFPLPESQLDRFMMRLSLGYPGAEAEKALLKRGDRRPFAARMQPLMTIERLVQLQNQAAAIPVNDAVLDYAYRLVVATRSQGVFLQGLSPRAGLAVISAAKSWALMAGRDHLLPEDVRAVFPAVASHRLKTLRRGQNSDSAVLELLRHAPAV